MYDKFIERYPTVRDLSGAKEAEIRAMIKPLGFHNQRAKQLVGIANKLTEDYKELIPSERNDLLSLPGVGDYIANAVLCFAFNKDVPIIDVNIRRVFGRAFEWGTSKDRKLMDHLRNLLPIGKAKEFNWAVIDFSSLICSRSPKCSKCFFAISCHYYNG